MYKSNSCDLFFPELNLLFGRKPSFFHFWGATGPLPPSSCAYGLLMFMRSLILPLVMVIVKIFLTTGLDNCCNNKSFLHNIQYVKYNRYKYKIFKARSRVLI